MRYPRTRASNATTGKIGQHEPGRAPRPFGLKDRVSVEAGPLTPLTGPVTSLMMSGTPGGYQALDQPGADLPDPLVGVPGVAADCLPRMTPDQRRMLGRKWMMLAAARTQRPD